MQMAYDQELVNVLDENKTWFPDVSKSKQERETRLQVLCKPE